MSAHSPTGAVEFNERILWVSWSALWRSGDELRSGKIDKQGKTTPEFTDRIDSTSIIEVDRFQQRHRNPHHDDPDKPSNP
jgi:hypothetical protein